MAKTKPKKNTKSPTKNKVGVIDNSWYKEDDIDLTRKKAGFYNGGKVK